MDGLPALNTSFGLGNTASPPTPLGAGGHANTLTKRQKAAIIVRVLLAGGAPLALRDLPEALQQELTREMADMRFVDHETVAAVVDEFAGEIDAIGLSFPRGLEGALSVLGEALSPATARRLRKQAGLPTRGDPWPRIVDADIERLTALVSAESTEVGAVLLSKLPVEKAAELLARLPGERARRVTYSVSLTEAIEPEAVHTIGRAIAAQLDTLPDQAFETPSVNRVGAILNVSRASLRDEVLGGLEETDAEFAAEVRKQIFTFANIPERIAKTDIPKIVKEVERPVLVTVLSAATEGPNRDAAEYVLSNMSQRLATQIREEVEGAGSVDEKALEEAEGTVIAAIRGLETSGEITIGT